MLWKKNTAILAKKTLCLFVTLLSHVLSCCAEDCVMDPTDKCICKTANNIINLNPIVQGKSAPVLKDQTAGAYTYSLQICLPAFTEPAGSSTTDCKDVAACQSTASQLYYSLGTHDSASFSGDPASGTLLLRFGTADRVANVNLRCDSSQIAKYEVVGQVEGKTKPSEYNFTLSTKYVCISEASGSSGLSTGSILVIMFFVLAFIYLVGGVLFLRFVRGARGVEQVPNHEFWSDFPLLIRDGVAFAVRGFKTDAVYEQI